MSKRHKKQQPHVQIKELKKQLDTFQLEVEHLLQDVPSTDNLCILCNNSNGQFDLPCNHVLCHYCQKEYNKIHCSICKKTYNLQKDNQIEKDSSSSSEEI